MTSYREAVRTALQDAMRGDERVVVLGQDVGARGGAYGVTAGLLEEFGAARVRDAPSSEAALVGIGVGAALAGLRPVVELTTSTYLGLAWDQVVHHLAAVGAWSGGALTAPMVLRVPQSGGAGGLGPVHSTNAEALLHGVPGLRVVAPATVGDAYGMVRAAIEHGDGPVVVLEHVGLYDAVGDVGGVASLDRAAVRRAGTDVTLVAASRMAALAARAAETLAAKHGFEAAVVDLRSLRPLDLETIRTAARGANGRVVVVEEGPPHGGVGATIAAALGGRVVRVSGADVFVPYASAPARAAVPDEDAIIRAALPLARVRDRRAIGAPDHTMSIDVSMEALVAARRASGGRTLGALIADAAGPLLVVYGEGVIVTDDGAITLVGENRRTSARAPATTLRFGPISTRPVVSGGAVVVQHLSSLTLTLAAGLATAQDATTLLAALREALERAP